MADREEAGAAAGFGLVGVDRHAVVVAAAGVGHVIAAATERPAIPGIMDVEGERRVDAYGGMQGVGRLPGAIADARDVFAHRAGGAQGQTPAVAGDDMALLVQANDPDL